MIKLDNIKMTANELAKRIVLDIGSGFDYYSENTAYIDTYELMTDREKVATIEACEKQFDRVQKFLNI